MTGQQSYSAGRIATAEAFAALWRKTFAKTQLSLMGLEPALTLETLEATLQALADAKATIADYENRITWHTTCGQCANGLDRAIADHERAERVEAELADARRRLAALSTEWTIGYHDEDGSPYYSGLTFTEAGAHHHARQDGGFPASRLVGEWAETSDKETDQ